MGVRGTDRGAPPIAKSVEFSSVPGREGLHLLGQSLRKKNPFFAALFRILTPRGCHSKPRNGIKSPRGKTCPIYFPRQQRRSLVGSGGRVRCAEAFLR